MRPNTLSPGRLNLTVGAVAVVLATVVTLGSALAGDPVARVVHLPGSLLADLATWVWPGLRQNFQSGLDLTTTCNILVLTLVFFGFLRHWAFRRRQG